MNAIILAAGKGARLNGIAGSDPKCLIRVGGLSLIERQVGILRECGIDRISIVVGYGADRVRNVCGSRVNYITNTIHDSTNSLYSLFLARRLLHQGAVIMNADVLFHPQLLYDLLEAKQEDALLIAYKDSTTPPFGDEEMKVKVRQDRVVEISKHMDPDYADGENVGIAKFGRIGGTLLVELLNLLIDRAAINEWAPRAYQDFAAQRPLHALATRGYPWIEIDFPEDFSRAVDEVLPNIEAFDRIVTQRSA
jgi:choline kinase